MKIPAALICALCIGTPASAQDAAALPPWFGALYYDVQQIDRSPGEAYWQTLTIGLQRRLPDGSIALQGIATRRFQMDDRAVVVDAYHDLWRGAYANARLQLAPDAAALPRYDAGAELFQAVGRVEVSGSYRRQEFEATGVGTLGLGLGVYAGNWYLRQRSLVANIDQSWSPFFAATARRYLGDSADDYFDLSAGFGEEVLEAAPAAGSTAVDVTTSGARFAAVRTQRFFGPAVGVLAGVAYSGYDDIPDRWGVSLGLITRW